MLYFLRDWERTPFWRTSLLLIIDRRNYSQSSHVCHIFTPEDTYVKHSMIDMVGMIDWYYRRDDRQMHGLGQFVVQSKTTLNHPTTAIMPIIDTASSSIGSSSMPWINRLGTINTASYCHLLLLVNVTQYHVAKW